MLLYYNCGLDKHHSEQNSMKITLFEIRRKKLAMRKDNNINYLQLVVSHLQVWVLASH